MVHWHLQQHFTVLNAPYSTACINGRKALEAGLLCRVDICTRRASRRGSHKLTANRNSKMNLIDKKREVS